MSRASTARTVPITTPVPRIITTSISSLHRWNIAYLFFASACSFIGSPFALTLLQESWLPLLGNFASLGIIFSLGEVLKLRVPNLVVKVANKIDHSMNPLQSEAIESSRRAIYGRLCNKCCSPIFYTHPRLPVDGRLALDFFPNTPVVGMTTASAIYFAHRFLRDQLSNFYTSPWEKETYATLELAFALFFASVVLVTYQTNKVIKNVTDNIITPCLDGFASATPIKRFGFIAGLKFTVTADDNFPEGSAATRIRI